MLAAVEPQYKFEPLSKRKNIQREATTNPSRNSERLFETVLQELQKTVVNMSADWQPLFSKLKQIVAHTSGDQTDEAKLLRA